MALTNASRLADFGTGIGTQGAILQVDNADQRVGIGTTDPDTKLEVKGTIKGIDVSVSGASTITGNLEVGGNIDLTGNITIGGTLTYEDVTNVDAVGLITARDGIVVGSGITLSKDGDIFFTGIMTGNGSGLTGVANTDVIFPDKISLGDNRRINLGIGSDLQLYHDGNSKIQNTNDSCDFRIQSNSVEIKPNTTDHLMAKFVSGGSCELYEANSKKLETDASGVTVTGRVAATSYTGDGSSLTGIAAGITTEAASISGITTYLDLTKDDHELIVTGANTISVIGGAQGTSHTLRIQNSGIATVTLDSTYFKFASGAAPAFPITSGAISLISFTVHKAGAVGVNTVLLTGASVNFS